MKDIKNEQPAIINEENVCKKEKFVLEGLKNFILEEIHLYEIRNILLKGPDIQKKIYYNTYIAPLQFIMQKITTLEEEYDEKYKD